MSVQSNKSQEPSMEEVLASIRRIISEEMENPSRSTPAKASEQAFDFPWSTGDQSSARPAAVQPKLPQNSVAPATAAPAQPMMRHPFMPAPRPAEVASPAPQAVTSAPAAVQPSLNNADFLSSYFAEIAQKNAVRGVPEAPVVSEQPASVEVAPVAAPSQPLAQSPFAGIIPPAPVAAPLETSLKIQLVPVAPAPVVSTPQPVPQPEAAVAVQPVDSKQAAPSSEATVKADAMVEALAAAFVEAKLLPHPSAEVKIASPEQAPVTSQPSEPAIAVVAPVDIVDAAATSMAADQADQPVSEETTSASTGVMSDRAAQVFSNSLANLTNTVKGGGAGGPYPRLDDFVAELMKPLISDWIDQNLERIVEEAVRDEIKRVSKLARS